MIKQDTAPSFLCPLAPLLPLWQDYLLAQRGLSPQTVASYGQDLENFFLFRQELAQGEAVSPQPDEQEIFLYLAWLRARQNTGRTLARRLSALRAFFDFAVQENAIKNNPAQLLDNPKLPQHLPEVLSRDEMESLLARPDLRDRGGQRDRCILELLYAAGLNCAICVCPIWTFSADWYVFSAREPKNALCRCMILCRTCLKITFVIGARLFHPQATSFSSIVPAVH